LFPFVIIGFPFLVAVDVIGVGLRFALAAEDEDDLPLFPSKKTIKSEIYF
jgi:hypothetical protein